MLQSLHPVDASRALLITMRALGGPGSGNFGHGGRPGEIGGSADTSGILSAIQKADGGFTYNPITGHSPTTGFALSLHKDREKVLTNVDLVTLAKYAKDNEDLLTESNNYLGGWHNPVDNKFYLDVSTVVSTASEAERLAKQEHQLAYFDLQKGQSVAVEHPHVKAATAYYRRGREEGANTRRLNRVGAQDDWARAYKGRDRRGAQDIRELGGPGSGNFGHSGRPGEIGGSDSGAEKLGASLEKELNHYQGVFYMTRSDAEKYSALLNASTTKETRGFIVHNKKGQAFGPAGWVELQALSAARDNNPLQQLADQHQKVVKVAIQYAFMVARKKLSSRNSKTIADALHGALLDVLPKTLLGVMTSGGNITLQSIRTLHALRTLAGPLKIRFDNTNPAASKWAKDHATELADDLSETTRERVRIALEDLFDGEATLDDVRDAVGDDTRADIIARTESMRAVNEGQRQGWDQAVEKGLLDEDSKRVWIATSEACPICEELDGTFADLDGEYPEPGGDGPPVHPNCRCTEGIAT